MKNISLLDFKNKHHDSVVKWQKFLDEKDSSEISRLLNSGFSFSISRDEYEGMKVNKSKPKYIYYYFGISEAGKFKILVIDSTSDKEMKFDKVLEKELGYSLEELGNKKALKELQKYPLSEGEEFKISSQEALNRSFRWKMFSQDWLKSKMIETKGVKKNATFFALLVNPFEDLENIFEPIKSEKCKDELVVKSSYAHHFFGLKKGGCNVHNTGRSLSYFVDKMRNYSMDIIITNFRNKDNIRDVNGDHSLCPGDPNKLKVDDFSLLFSDVKRQKK